MARVRLDQLLVDRGLAASRDRAQRLIHAGQVLVDETPVDKPGTKIPDDAVLRCRVADHPYVGRGGLKLAGALDDLGVDPQGLRCLDVGASTGGFTDCLLQRGAEHVVAVDVGTNQLAWRLRQDPRVTTYEQTDARALRPDQLGGRVDLVVIDCSFISVRSVLPPVLDLLAAGTQLVALIKPQFEAGRAAIGRGGRVRDEAQRTGAVAAVRAAIEALGVAVLGEVDCRLEGAKSGNREVFLHLRVVSAGSRSGTTPAC